MTVLYWIADPKKNEVLPFLQEIDDITTLVPLMKKHGATLLQDLSTMGWNRRSESFEFEADKVLFMVGSAKDVTTSLEKFQKDQASRVGFKSVPNGAPLVAIGRGDGFLPYPQQEYVVMVALGAAVDMRIPVNHSVPHKTLKAANRTVDAPKNLIDIKDVVTFCKQLAK